MYYVQMLYLHLSRAGSLSISAVSLALQTFTRGSWSVHSRGSGALVKGTSPVVMNEVQERIIHFPQPDFTWWSRNQMLRLWAHLSYLCPIWHIQYVYILLITQILIWIRQEVNFYKCHVNTINTFLDSGPNTPLYSVHVNVKWFALIIIPREFPGERLSIKTVWAGLCIVLDLFTF